MRAFPPVSFRLELVPSGSVDSVSGVLDRESGVTDTESGVRDTESGVIGGEDGASPDSESGFGGKLRR